MCEMKTSLLSVCLILLVTASFCMYWVYPEKNVRQYSEIKIQNLWKMSTRSILSTVANDIIYMPQIL